MSRTKPKKVSLRSRTLRRATSPSINTDKSLKTISRPSLPGANILRPTNSAAGTGISKTNRHHHKSQQQQQQSSQKKSSKKKRLSRDQRLRLEKAIERAEVRGDKLDTRIRGSVLRAKRVVERAGDWGDVNARLMPGVRKRRMNRDGGGNRDGEEEDENENENGNEEDMVVEGWARLKIADSAAAAAAGDGGSSGNRVHDAKAERKLVVEEDEDEVL